VEEEMEGEGKVLCPSPELNELCARGARVDLGFVVGGEVGKDKKKGEVEGDVEFLVFVTDV
jgi:hypothetical protein